MIKKTFEYKKFSVVIGANDEDVIDFDIYLPNRYWCISCCHVNKTLPEAEKMAKTFIDAYIKES